jgi:N6-adenosine-specific RNA methylase IME4
MGADQLIKYDTACRALAEAKAVDEAKDIRDQAMAMRLYAKQAKNKNLEADAFEIRIRAERRVGELIALQENSVGLNKGGRPRTGVSKTPVSGLPTLAEAGIDKNLAKHARIFRAMPEARFKQVIAEGRDAINRGVERQIVRAVEIAASREEYNARKYQGGTIDDLRASIASGYRAGVISIDAPWPFETYSGKGKQRSAERHYDTMTLDEIKALPVGQLAADSCALFAWSVQAKYTMEAIEAWGFDYRKEGFIWVKTKPSIECIPLDDKGQYESLHNSLGYSTRNNAEICYLAIKGEPPLRLNCDVNQVIIAPVGEHSAKPDEACRRMARLYPGPYLELFARQPREGWTVWGNEIEKCPAEALRPGSRIGCAPVANPVFETSFMQSP